MENPKNSVRSKGPNTKTTLRRVQSIVLNETRQLTQKPAWFEIVAINDDVTTAEFVVQMLEEHFYKKSEEASSLMLKIHQDGEGVCGAYTREVAETKIAEVIEDARRASYPLKCVMRRIK